MRENKSTRYLNQALFVGPAVLLFVMFVGVPFVFSVVVSFTKWSGISSSISFVGAKNYIRILSDKDFFSSLRYTLKNTVTVTILANVIGLAFAWCLSFRIWGRGFFRTALVLPNILSGIVLGFIWKFIFMKGLPGIGEWLGIDLLTISWLGGKHSAFWSIVIVAVWQMAGYVMLVYYSGILNVPQEVIESAYVDRATNWQIFRYIVLPSLKPACLICTFWTISKSLVLYDLPFALTQGGPFKSTETLAINIYREAFEKNDYGYGSAKAIAFFAVVMVTGYLQLPPPTGASIKTPAQSPGRLQRNS